MTQLTPYDTGAVLEPKVWPTERDADGKPIEHTFGLVDFENDESASVLTVRVVRDDETGGYTVIVADLASSVFPVTIQHEKN